MATGLAPKVSVIERPVAAVAAGSDLNTVLGKVPFDGTVTGVEYLPLTAITGADTNTRSITAKNAGQAGSGTTAVATLALASGVNAAAKTGKAVTLSGTAANLDVVKGDVLYWESTHAASGLADPGGVVRVTITRA